MAQIGVKNKSAYIRKMAIDGHMIILETPELKEIGRLLRITANNVNQLARRVNSGDEAHRKDVAEVSGQLTEIRTLFGSILAQFAAFDNAKPGRRYIPPSRAERDTATGGSPAAKGA